MYEKKHIIQKPSPSGHWSVTYRTLGPYLQIKKKILAGKK